MRNDLNQSANGVFDINKCAPLKFYTTFIFIHFCYYVIYFFINKRKKNKSWAFYFTIPHRNLIKKLNLKSKCLICSIFIEKIFANLINRVFFHYTIPMPVTRKTFNIRFAHINYVREFYDNIFVIS